MCTFGKTSETLVTSAWFERRNFHSLTVNIPHSIKLLFHLAVFLWAGEKQLKIVEALLVQTRLCAKGAAASQRWPFMATAGVMAMMKETHIPAVSICAALWRQQLKRFGELHHLKAKKTSPTLWEWFTGRAEKKNSTICAPTQVKAKKTLRQCCEITPALNVLLVLLRNTRVGVSRINCAAVFSSL